MPTTSTSRFSGTSCQVTTAVAVELGTIIDQLLPQLDQDGQTELQELKRLLSQVRSNGDGVSTLPFQLAVTPYLVCSWPVNNAESSDHIYLQKHHKSGLLVPIGGGKIDQTDQSIHAGMLREFFEEADSLPWIHGIIEKDTDVFDIGLIRDKEGNLQMVDIRRAFRVHSSPIGKHLAYNERPKDGVSRGTDGVLIPLSELIAWENRTTSDKPFTIDTHDDSIELSSKTAQEARTKDSLYFRRFHRLAQRINSVPRPLGE